MWIGYKIAMKEMNIPTIVAIYETFPEKLEVKDRFLSFEAIQKELGDMSQEAKYVANYEQRNKMQFAPEELQRLQKCLDAHTERLMNEHSNLLIVSASKVKSVRYGLSDASLQHKSCIVLYVNLKGVIPLGEEPFPSEIDGIQVDVRESIYKNYIKKNEHLETLMMGCQITTDFKKSGTLGAFVELKSDDLGCLTCYHLFEDSNAQSSNSATRKVDIKMKQVYQPTKDYDAFGKLEKVIDKRPYKNTGITVDAALIKITDKTRIPTSGRFPNAESPSCGMYYRY